MLKFSTLQRSIFYILTRLNEVLAGGGSDVREAHQDAVPQDPGGDNMFGGGGTGQREDGHHSLQTVTLTGRGTHHLPALHQVPQGQRKYMQEKTINISPEISCAKQV